MKQLTKLELAETYCKVNAHRTPEEMAKILSAQVARFPDLEGWVLWECHDMSSSRMGMVVVMPYGPSNTFKSIDTLPACWSPTGMASDMSVAVAYAKREPWPNSANHVAAGDSPTPTGTRRPRRPSGES